MKKIIQILLTLILLLILSLIIIFIFNPLGSRDKIIGSIINNYLANNIKGYAPASQINSGAPNNEPAVDKHPFLNESQEKMLENLGVDVSQLPTEITPGMESCALEKFGKERIEEIIGGATPSALELFKAKDCIGK